MEELPVMEPNRATVRDLRRRNRSTLLSMLYFDGPFSRRVGISAERFRT